MFRRSLATLVLIGVALSTFACAADVRQADTIIALERSALDRWGRGDPNGYLELYASDVTYFDPLRDRRIDGSEAMRQALEPLKGLVKVDRYEMIAPHVQISGDVAILTYNLVSHSRTASGMAATTRWNSTAVYRLMDGRWKIVHSHWSFTKPDVKLPT